MRQSKDLLLNKLLLALSCCLPDTELSVLITCTYVAEHGDWALRGRHDVEAGRGEWRITRARIRMRCSADDAQSLVSDERQYVGP